MKTILSQIKGVLVLVLAFSLNAMSQTDFAEQTADVSKIKARQDFPLEGRPSKNGGGWSVNVSIIPEMPRRVALVTFYLEDPGMSDQKKSSGATTTTITANMWATDPASAAVHIQGFYDESIDDLKAGFDKMGMELLTPDQFLDTEEKKSFFYGFQPAHGSLKKEKTMSKSLSGAGMLSIARTRIPAAGYPVIWTANEWPNMTTASEKFVSTNKNDAKFFESMGYYLTEALGVDAVAAVTIVTRKMDKDKTDYGVNHVNLYMFTKNPIVLPEEEDKGLKGLFYIKGQFLAGSRVTYGKPALFQYQHKKKGYGPDYTGIGNVMTAMTTKINDYFVKKRED
ncbi:MAG: hypothetical protein ABJG41_00240 [Cyclobacteriaceae bacterium]